MNNCSKIQKNPEFRKCTKLLISIKKITWNFQVEMLNFGQKSPFPSTIVLVQYHFCWVLDLVRSDHFQSKIQKMINFSQKLLISLNNWVSLVPFLVNFGSIWVQIQSEVTIFSQKYKKWSILVQNYLFPSATE